MFIWWGTWININHGVWYFVYWITILSLQFSLGLTLSKALFNFCKICLSCLILPMKLVVFTLTKSHNSSLFIYLLIGYCFLLRRLLKIDLIREEVQAIKKIVFQQMLLLLTFIINAMLSILFTALHKAKYILNIFLYCASLPLIFPFKCNRGCSHYLGAHLCCNISIYWAMTHDFTEPFKLQWSFLLSLSAACIEYSIWIHYITVALFPYHIAY